MEHVSLSQDKLVDKIWEVVQDAASGSIDIDTNQFPNMPEPLATRFAKAYDEYAQDAEASPLTLASRGSTDDLSTSMQQPNMTGWASGIGDYWRNSNFTGDGFADQNTVTGDSADASVAALDAGVQNFITFPDGGPATTTEGVIRLAALLHSGTLGFQVVTTTSDSSGSQETVPIT